MKIIIYSIGILAFFGVLVLGVRFFAGGDEDAWLCDGGRWVRHGNPSGPLPDTPCGSAPTVELFFQNFNRISDDCSIVFPVIRTVSPNHWTLDGVLSELFKGPTTEEVAAGFSSVFSTSSTSILRQAFLKNETVYIDLNDIRLSHSAVSASCGSAAFFSSIEETLRSFFGSAKRPEVRYAINGDPSVFYEWVQLGCDKKIGNCDPAPFRDVERELTN